MLYKLYAHVNQSDYSEYGQNSSKCSFYIHNMMIKGACIYCMAIFMPKRKMYLRWSLIRIFTEIVNE